ncbi:MAG TPA: diguanylate cyclase, partial [Acetobacteraceae bacterium]
QLLEEANRRLATLALEDALTGLANRRRFDDALLNELRRAHRMQEFIAVAMIRIDGFKSYCDRYGHVQGDACLRRVARALSGNLHRPTDLAARYDAERFVVLLPGTEPAGAALVAGRMVAAVRALSISHPLAPMGVVTASAGTVALLPVRARALPGEVVAQAEAALDAARVAGGDCVRDVLAAEPPGEAASGVIPSLPAPAT